MILGYQAIIEYLGLCYCVAYLLIQAIYNVLASA